MNLFTKETIHLFKFLKKIKVVEDISWTRYIELIVTANELQAWQERNERLFNQILNKLSKTDDDGEIWEG